MIIVKLIGGLGNQMFQYAVSRNLAHKYNAELKLDIRSFKNYKLRNYSLGQFNIVENFVTLADLSHVLPRSEMPAVRMLKYVIRNIPLVQHIDYVKEKGDSFQQNILKLQDNVYLDGYWQSEKYFLDIEEIIIKEFSMVNSLTMASKDIADQIKDCESVSIHVRRGDYVSNPETNSVHGVCGLEFYFKAIGMIREKIDNPCFFIFSDDPEWACCNIKPDAPTIYVKHNDCSKDSEDICLMSMCKHHIIANSSFSWWGAWLSRNPDKTVIAPRRWFKQKECNTNDRLPESWIKL